MRSSSQNTRRLFFSVLTAILAVYFVGRYWMKSSGPSETTEAGFLAPIAGEQDAPPSARD